MAVQPSERVVFGGSMEGLYRALQPLTPQERAAFLKAGVTGEKFAAAYPLQQYVDVQNASAASRFAHLPEDDRYFEIGRLFIAGYEKTLLGNAMLAMIRLIGPRRSLDRLTRSMRTANNFSEGTHEALAPNHHRITINFTIRPGFYRGILFASLEHAGAKELQITTAATRDMVTTYEVTWK
ncbi:MAG: DUF2378 family protein [Archangium sp.]|nr:DUF2378 family protein [Archangium sp.]